MDSVLEMLLVFLSLPFMIFDLDQFYLIKTLTLTFTSIMALIWCSYCTYWAGPHMKTLGCETPIFRTDGELLGVINSERGDGQMILKKSKV